MEPLPPLGIHIEEEVDIAEILGGQDEGESPDPGEPEEPQRMVQRRKDIPVD